MARLAIVTDSVACLPPDVVETYGIRVVPAANIMANGQTYRDWVDISPAKAYELLHLSPSSFGTSAISPGVFLEAFCELGPQVDGILCITLSSELSAVHSMAQVAGEQARARCPGLEIEILDSRTASAAEGLVVLAAARVAESGGYMRETVAVAEQVREEVAVVGLLDTVRYVYRTGRVPKIAAWVGSALQIKPIFAISGGRVRTVGIVRSKARGVDRLMDMIRRDVDARPVHIAVMHAAALEEAMALKERLAERFDCVETLVTEFSPVMGYATGPGVVGVAYYAVGRLS